MLALTRFAPAIFRRRLQGMTPLTPTLTKQLKQLAIQKGAFNVLFIGAGSAYYAPVSRRSGRADSLTVFADIHFGSDEGPWSAQACWRASR